MRVKWERVVLLFGNVQGLGGACRALASRIRTFVSHVPVLVVYTALFLILAALSFSPLIINGKSLIWAVDGLEQQFEAFLSLGLSVREAVRGFLAGEGFHLPAYDLSSGYGMPASYSYEPLAYLSVLCPSRYADLLFNLLVLARLWLCGATFMLLGRRLRFTRAWLLIAACAYVFSSVGLQSTWQSGYLNQPMLFPLVILGALRLMDEGRPTLYVVSTALFTYVCGLYFTYMAQVLVAVLVAVRLVARREGRVSAWLRHLASFLSALLVALLCAAPVVLGNFASLSSLDRLSVAYDNPFLYSLEYYQEIFTGFLGLYRSGRDWLFGYGALPLLMCAVLFARRDRSLLVAKALFAILTAMVLVPFFGLALNGFAYTANRWIWAYALLIASIVGAVGSSGMSLSAREVKRVGCILAGYSLLSLVFQAWNQVAVLQQLVIVWLLFSLLVAWSASASPLAGQRAVLPAFFCIAFAALGLNYHQYLSPQGMNWTGQLVDANAATARLTDAAPIRMVREHAEGVERFDRESYSLDPYVFPVDKNVSGVLGVYGVDFYSSFYNNDVDVFHAELALIGTDSPNSYYTLNSRSSLREVLGVKHLVNQEDAVWPASYGRSGEPVDEMIAWDGRAYALYGVEGAGSIAHVFSRAISRSTYEDLSPLERQEALLQGVVLDDAIAGGDALQPEATSQRVAIQDIELAEGMHLAEDGKRLIVHTPGTSVTLRFNAPASAETYLYVRSLDYDAYDPVEEYYPEVFANLSAYDRQAAITKRASWSEPSFMLFDIDSDISRGSFSLYTPSGHLYGGKDTWLYNLGYSDERTTFATITFTQPGEYSFEEFGVYTQPMGTLDAAKRAAAENPIADLAFEGDVLSCTAASQDDGYLFLAVPFHEGWSATVNGEPVEILRADTAFMAVPVEAGESEVRFTFAREDGSAWAIAGITAGASAALWYAVGRNRVRSK